MNTSLALANSWLFSHGLLILLVLILKSRILLLLLQGIANIDNTTLRINDQTLQQ